MLFDVSGPLYISWAHLGAASSVFCAPHIEPKNHLSSFFVYFWLCCFAFLLVLLLAFALICFRHCFAFALALLCFWCCCWLLLLLLALICFQHCFAFDFWACQRSGGRAPAGGCRPPAGGHRPESPGRRLTHQWRSKGEQVCGIWIWLLMLLRNTFKNNQKSTKKAIKKYGNTRAKIGEKHRKNAVNAEFRPVQALKEAVPGDQN